MRWSYLLLIAVVLFSCDKNVVFKQFDSDFDQNRWQRTDVKTYEMQIEQQGVYDLEIDFSYVAGIQFAEIPIYFQLIDPEGTIEKQDVILQTKTPEGTDVGDCVGDYCDMRHVVLKSKPLKPGKYTVKLNNAFNNAYLPNVIGVGIRLSNAQ